MSVGTPISLTVGAGSLRSLRLVSDGMTADVSVPAGALPNGTLVSLFPIAESAGFALDLPSNRHFLVAFAVNWTGPQRAQKPLTLVVSGRSIRQGYVISEVTSSGLKEAGEAHTDGIVPITFNSGLAFVVAGVPIVKVVSKSTGYGSSGIAIAMSCAKPYACSGSVALFAANGARRTMGKAKKPSPVAIANFSLAAGSTKTVLLQPTVDGRTVLSSLRGARRMTVEVSGTGGPVVEAVLTVRRGAGGQT